MSGYVDQIAVPLRGPRGGGDPAPLVWLSLPAASVAVSAWIAASALRSIRVGRAVP